ncbi:MAG TPA: CHAT domain-containing protein [Thermoanaerobaculia bacterium]|nr:CHAT domain-containing protein [Thermoanaerobaculia bacterium]
MTRGEESEVEIRSLGSDLCRQLLEPCGLLSLLWSLQHRITTLLLVSDESWIPWELIRLEDPAGGGSETGRYLCEAFAFARWLTGSEPTLDLPMRRMALVASDADSPAGLKEEKEFLEKQQSVARSVDSVPARRNPLLQALASGGYDGWHFCGHGGQSVSNDANQAYLVLDDDQALTPSVLRSEAAGMGRSHPFVFLNGCHTGRGGLGLTLLGGWATQLLASGAGAFLGSLWAINGYRAAEFAQAFYLRLFAGVPIAQAVRDARQVSRSAGDPSWLAYSLYSHPLASCSGMIG